MTHHDIAVIGAGVAGLGCAHKLRARGVDVVVVEARDRVGGRIRAVWPDGETPVEVGAQVVHGEWAVTWKVIERAGLRVEPLGVDDEFVVAMGGHRFTADAVPEGVVPPWAVEEAITRRPRPGAPAAEACGDHVDGPGRALATEWLAQVWASDPDQLSATGMAEIRRRWRSGRQDWVVLDGYQRIPEVLAAGLDVRLGTAVRRVRWSDNGVVLECVDTGTGAPAEPVQATAAVVTVPPTVVTAGRLAFDPSLPPEKTKAAHQIPLGPAVVAVVTLAEPAPRSVWGLSVATVGGFVRARARSSTVTISCKGPGARRVPGARWDAALVTELLGPVLDWFDPDLVTGVEAVDWGADPWAGGAFSYPRCGGLDAPHTWAAPVGRVLFFAGEATCGDLHPATVHGALESGISSSEQVLSTLAHS